MRLFWKGGPGGPWMHTLVGTKAKNRPLSVLSEGYWTAYGDRSSKVKYGSSPAPAGAGA